jgi:hypothetical protein
MDGRYIKSAFKVFLIVAVAGFIIQAISFGIYYYNTKNFAEKGNVKSEKERCERVLRREEGDLTDYSHCKLYLRWLNVNTTFND